MANVDKYEREDRITLERALLALGQCPHCRQDLRPVRSFGPDVLGCDGSKYQKHSPETWYLPNLAPRETERCTECGSTFYMDELSITNDGTGDLLCPACTEGRNDA